MEKYKEYEVDATDGPRVTPGQTVAPGQLIGISPEGSQVICRCHGVVISNAFEGESHSHHVLIRLAPDAGDTPEGRLGKGVQ